MRRHEGKRTCAATKFVGVILKMILTTRQMASIWKDERSPYWIACFTASMGQQRAQWKRGTFTKDRKTARRVADELEEAAQGGRDSAAITTLLNGIADLSARRRLYRVFDIVLQRTTGCGLGGKSVRSFVNGSRDNARRSLAGNRS